MRTNLPPHLSEAGVSLDAMSFADRLVERHLAGTASVEDLLDAEIDAPTIHAVAPARRRASRVHLPTGLLQEDARRWRSSTGCCASRHLTRPTAAAGPAARSATMLLRENEVIELVRANGGYRTCGNAARSSPDPRSAPHQGSGQGLQDAGDRERPPHCDLP